MIINTSSSRLYQKLFDYWNQWNLIYNILDTYQLLEIVVSEMKDPLFRRPIVFYLHYYELVIKGKGERF